jgi:hypothetical protein
MNFFPVMKVSNDHDYDIWIEDMLDQYVYPPPHPSRYSRYRLVSCSPQQEARDALGYAIRYLHAVFGKYSAKTLFDAVTLIWTTLCIERRGGPRWQQFESIDVHCSQTESIHT